MSRHGKIARMPAHLRRAINERLEQGHDGEQILDWLNREPEALAVLAQRFGGRPVNQQNLSHWRRGGYQDWQRQEQAGGLTERLFGKAGADALPDTRRMATGLMAELLAVFKTWQDPSADREERWRRLTGALGVVARLRVLEVQSDRVELDRIKQRAILDGKPVTVGKGEDAEAAWLNRMMDEGLQSWVEKDLPGLGVDRKIQKILDWCSSPAKAPPVKRRSRRMGAATSASPAATAVPTVPVRSAEAASQANGGIKVEPLVSTSVKVSPGAARDRGTCLKSSLPPSPVSEDAG